MKKEVREMLTKFGISCLVVVLCLSFFVGCGTGDSKKPEEIATTPTEKEKADLLRQIDRKFENSEAHYQLGKIYQSEGLWAQAEYQYNVALSFDPAYRAAQAATIKVLQSSGDATKAAMSADLYISQVSGSAMESLRLGIGFQKEELDDYALMCYQQALRLAPNSAKINRQIGYYYLSKGDTARAREYLHRSIQLNPNQPEVARELGKLGVTVHMPSKKSTRDLEKIVDESDEQIMQ